MNDKKYTPVDPDFYDVIKTQQKREDNVVHYFDPNENIETARGKIDQLISSNGTGDFLAFSDQQQVRIDRIITINGRPGPAYDEYDSFALQCLDCQGGMD